MIRKALLPDQESECKLSLGTERESTLYILSRFFQWDVRCGRKDEMKMVWHDDKLVQQEAAFGPILLQDIDQKQSRPLRL
jgi:hypothetical protein